MEIKEVLEELGKISVVEKDIEELLKEINTKLAKLLQEIRQENIDKITDLLNSLKDLVIKEVKIERGKYALGGHERKFINRLNKLIPEISDKEVKKNLNFIIDTYARKIILLNVLKKKINELEALIKTSTKREVEALINEIYGYVNDMALQGKAIVDLCIQTAKILEKEQENIEKINIKELARKVAVNLNEINNLNHHEVAALIKLLKEKGILAKLPFGNRAYLEKALEWYEKNPFSKAAINYMEGAKKHLTMALPHQINFFLPFLNIKLGVPLFDEIMNGKRTLDQLSATELITFAKIIERNRILSSLRAYQGSRNAVRAIIHKYNSLFMNYGRQEAEKYAKEKRQSLLNIFKKTYLPNLIGAIARGEIKL